MYLIEIFESVQAQSCRSLNAQNRIQFLKGLFCQIKHYMLGVAEGEN